LSRRPRGTRRANETRGGTRNSPGTPSELRAAAAAPVVVGLVANLLFAAWWIDAVTSLGIVWFVVKEAREAWSGESCCSHD
jgi:hypothetical protein